ncbi:MAG: endopeptidase La [Acidaminococcales bacterium]|jgi:ATP-dependent Lon protease|nr:endopeptidase La [Acidaminococcales bacterium]
MTIINNGDNQRAYPLLPLRGILVFPTMIIHLDVGRDKSIKALEAAMLNDRLIMLATQKEAHTENPGLADIFPVGTLMQIKLLQKLPGGGTRILVEGMRRASIREFDDSGDYIAVKVTEHFEEDFATPEIETLKRLVGEQFEQWVKNGKKIPSDTLLSILGVEEAGRLSDIIAGHLAINIDDKQKLLNAINVSERLNLLYDILSRELEILEIEKKISQRVRKQVGKNQKEYYLREQIKAINKELGDKDDRLAETAEFRQRLSAAGLPEEVREKIGKEIGRLEKMPAMTSESAVVRSYIDILLSLPWTAVSEDNLDMARAEKILDEDHYGLEKVKERILEYLAVRSLTADMKGPILCLVGPPGVGKTSIAKSVARAMGRKFTRASLGGIKDEAEIRGHRRTYVGSLPGRIIQGMRNCGFKNPVFLLDEVDKLSSDFRGDPSSALLEVLDPEQNNAFSDHYVELPFDLSKVFWIVTANITHPIPKPLLDRMEVISIPGYTELEKKEIASRYLMPKQIKQHGLDGGLIGISEKAVIRIIREYTREAGVRELERGIASVCRKAARRVLKKNKKSGVSVTASNIPQYLGVPKYTQTEKRAEPETGVATGLAWTSVGGEVLEVETSVTRGKGDLLLTGQMGDVMKESARAGYTYIRRKADELKIPGDFYKELDIHVHLPEGAIPKDGPSAGITMATSMASALTGRRVYADMAMTGEITLRGRVLPVGGIKEKVLAAHRYGVKKVVLPVANEKDLEDIPPTIKKSIEFVPVSHMDEVLALALEDANA